VRIGRAQTLVVDNDRQGNASSVLGERGHGTSDYAGGQPLPLAAVQIHQIHQPTRYGSTNGLEAAACPHDRERFDIIFIDCPPNLSLLPINALLAASHFVGPLQCEYYALEGLSQLLAYVAVICVKNI
jgi:cellulose biosynthesis protein BcsQ